MSGDVSAETRRAQTGLVLVMALLVLLTLTLLALTGAHSAAIQQRLAANAQDQALALARADRALKTGEHWLLHHGSTSPPSGCPGNCPADHPLWTPFAATDRPVHQHDGWWLAHGETLDGARALDGGHAEWLAEILPVPAQPWPPSAGSELHWYRVSARGSGRNGRPLVAIESVFARPWGTDLPPGWQGSCRRRDGPPCGRQAWRRVR